MKSGDLKIALPGGNRMVHDMNNLQLHQWLTDYFYKLISI
jgi:hypothetical protein